VAAFAFWIADRRQEESLLSCPGLTRASIRFCLMDCRVKPGNDELDHGLKWRHT
jgi:hypothetical protein